jgi:carboxyl-terminal processing protease
VSRASHLAAFAAGAVAVSTVGAFAVPRPDQQRYKTLDAFAQSIADVEENYVDAVDEKALVYDAIRGMVQNLDPHSAFLPPNRYKRLRQDTEGEFGGVGITLAPGQLDDARPSVPPFPTIDEVAPGSPADAAGLQPDDRVTAIDNEPTAAAGHELRDASAWEVRMRGASGTRVTLTISRVGWPAPKLFTIVRAQVKVASVRQHVLEPRIGYLQIAHFTEGTAADAAAALTTLRTAGALDVLVLDLRSDPGGLVDAAVAIADQFLDGGVIVTIRGRHGHVDTQNAHPGGLALAVPVIAIVDGGTASAAEILAAALHDHGRATLVGVPTYGKGTVQTFYDLDDGSGLKLTTARYYTPKGKSLDSNGMVPDLRVDTFAPEEIVSTTVATKGGAGPVTGATIAEPDEDPQLTAAVKLARLALHGQRK